MIYSFDDERRGGKDVFGPCGAFVGRVEVVGGGGGMCDGNEISRLSLKYAPIERAWLVTNHTVGILL